MPLCPHGRLHFLGNSLSQTDTKIDEEDKAGKGKHGVYYRDKTITILGGPWTRRKEEGTYQAPMARRDVLPVQIRWLFKGKTTQM